MSEQLTFTYMIDGDDFTRAGEASSSVKNKLKMLGVSSDAIRKVAIAMYEGEINMVIHAEGGTIPLLYKGRQDGIPRPGDYVGPLGLGAGMDFLI